MPTKATRASGVLSFDSSGVAAITPLAQLYAMASDVDALPSGAWSGATAYVADAVSLQRFELPRARRQYERHAPARTPRSGSCSPTKGAAADRRDRRDLQGGQHRSLSTLARSPALTLRASRSRTPARSSGPSTSPLSRSPQRRPFRRRAHCRRDRDTRRHARPQALASCCTREGSAQPLLYGKWNVNWIGDSAMAIRTASSSGVEVVETLSKSLRAITAPDRRGRARLVHVLARLGRDRCGHRTTRLSSPLRNAAANPILIRKFELCAYINGTAFTAGMGTCRPSSRAASRRRIRGRRPSRSRAADAYLRPARALRTFASPNTGAITPGIAHARLDPVRASRLPVPALSPCPP